MLTTRCLPGGWAARRLLVGAIILAGASFGGSISARADDCAIILKAFEALAAAPAYSQSVTMKDGATLRFVVIGDVMYVNDGSNWNKIPFKASDRRNMLKQLVPDDMHLKNCTRVGSEAIDGAAMTVYSYIAPVPKGMEALVPTNVVQKVWVGVSDGLPRRMTTDSVDMNIRFDGVTAPIP